MQTEIKTEKKVYKNWKCRICGYIYQVEKGDPLHLVPPNTPFEKLPSNWRCPICKYSKAHFYQLKDACWYRFTLSRGSL